MRNLTRFIIPVITLALPLSASAVTAEELQAQVQALLQQVQQLQSIYGTQPSTGVSTGTSVTPTGAPCPALSRGLSYGMKGSDVTALQQFLAADPSVYPEGLVTGYFGSLTQAAVQRFQVKYGVVSSGTPSTTGYGRVGPQTQAAISNVCGGSTGSAASSAQLGAVMSVTPISGAAPLFTTFQVTVNTGYSCAAAIYTLDFGDGSSQPIPSVAGLCKPQSITVAHSFQYAGSYKVTLSSGGSQTYTTVSVTGATKPVPAGTDATPKAAVSIADYSFSPGTVTVNPGTRVTWTNTGVVAHSVTSDTGVFDSGAIAPGATYTIEFDQPGTYPYHCAYHGVPGSGDYGLVVVNAVTTGTTQTTSTTASATQSGSGYGPLSLSAQGGKKVLASFDLASTCDAYVIDWGDGSVPQYSAASFSGCSPTQPITLSHTYSDAGSYTVTLDRGAALDNEVTQSISVS